MGGGANILAHRCRPLYALSYFLTDLESWMAYVSKPGKCKWIKYCPQYVSATNGDDNDVNLSKQKFYTMLLEKGMSHMYASNYDVIDDSPVMRNDGPSTSGDKAVTVDPSPSTKTKKRKKVLIVGAGMAGLAAAYELKRSGHKVRQYCIPWKLVEQMFCIQALYEKTYSSGPKF